MHLTKTSTALGLTAFMLILSGCQTLGTPMTSQPEPLPTQNQEAPLQFAITGKIGLTTTLLDGSRQAGSAFYAWGQTDDRFSIDLTGVLGMGATRLEYNGSTATLTNDKGSLSADTPEELLAKATGWHAPISQLAYWAVGRPAPQDTDSQYTDGVLTQSQNDGWHATFTYPSGSTLPNHLTITHPRHRVVMTITHPNP